jgi:hypothetical protein
MVKDRELNDPSLVRRFIDAEQAVVFLGKPEDKLGKPNF